MIREAITKLVDNQPLTRIEARDTLREIMQGDATPAQIASFITALRIRGETAEVITGCAQAMRENFTAVEPHVDLVIDTCGTGGDGAHTFNISTAAAFVSAGAGIAVAKHGNRSVSSKCGSADVLTALGVNVNIPPDAMSACLKEHGIAFLFAPALHLAMKHAIGPRREIGIRTIFNILGPLSNPAGAKHGVLGVYSLDLVYILAEAALALGSDHLFVVHGLDGLDEITTTQATRIAEIKDGKIESYEIWPGDFGMKPAKPRDLQGGEPAENARILRSVLSGGKGPHRDIVLLNSAAAIMAGNRAPDFPSALKQAEQSIDSGAAMLKLESLIAFTSQYSAA